MEIAIVALLLVFGVPIIAILSNTVIKLAKMRMEHRPPTRELTGEQALFGLTAAEDLRDLKGRMDRLEAQIAQIAQAVQPAAPLARSLDPITDPAAAPQEITHQA